MQASSVKTGSKQSTRSGGINTRRDSNDKKGAAVAAGSTMSERDIAALMRYILGGRRQEADDLGYGTLGSSSGIALNTDTMVQGTDIPPGMTLRQAARKSIIACVSDFAAKGIRPKVGTVSVCAQKNTGRAEITGIARGFAEGARSCGVSIVAGDTNAGAEFSFCVSMVGRRPAGRIPSRGGARTGDVIFVSGPFGYTALGLDMLLSDRDAGARDATEKRALRSVLMPSARLEFGICIRKYITSSMDSSDGLAVTLCEMARQSGRRFEICEMPVTMQLKKYAQKNSIDVEEMVFHGGEEYEIVFTAAPVYRSSITKLAARLGVPLAEIGTVGERAKRAAAYIIRDSDSGAKRRQIRDSGWDHFA